MPLFASRSEELFSGRVSGGHGTIAFLQHFVGLGDREVIGNAAKIAEDLFLFDVERLKNNGPASHVYIDKDLVPVIIGNLLLNDLKGAALVQVTEQSPTEFNLFDQAAFDHGQPHGFAIDPKFANHGVIDHQLTR